MDGGRFCSYLGRKLKAVTVLTIATHHLLQYSSNPSFRGPEPLTCCPLCKRAVAGLLCPGSHSLSKGSCPFSCTQVAKQEGFCLLAAFYLGSPCAGAQSHGCHPHRAAYWSSRFAVRMVWPRKTYCVISWNQHLC